MVNHHQTTISWQFCDCDRLRMVSFRDLQGSGIKRSRVESPGTWKLIGCCGWGSIGLGNIECFFVLKGRQTKKIGGCVFYYDVWFFGAVLVDFEDLTTHEEVELCFAGKVSQFMKLCFAACESVYVFDDMEQAHKGGFVLVSKKSKNYQDLPTHLWSSFSFNFQKTHIADVENFKTTLKGRNQESESIWHFSNRSAVRKKSWCRIVCWEKHNLPFKNGKRSWLRGDVDVSFLLLPRAGKIGTPLKANMTMEKQPFEDVLYLTMLVFRGVRRSSEPSTVPCVYIYTVGFVRFCACFFSPLA